MIADSEFVYVFDRLDQRGLELLRRAAAGNQMTMVNPDDAASIGDSNFVPFRFTPSGGASASTKNATWKSILRSDSWSKVLYHCPLKNTVVSIPNNYVDGFNGPTKIGRLSYKGAEVLLLADFHGSEDNMCYRSSRGFSRGQSSDALEKKPRMEEWVNKFVEASSSESHCPVVDVVLEAMDAELETGAPYPLDKAVNHFSPCLEQKRMPGRCGRHRFHKIDIRHGTRFPTVGDFEVVIDSFYGRSSTSASRSKSIEVWQRIFNDLQPMYAGRATAQQVVQKILQREPQLVGQLQLIADQEEKNKLLHWLTSKVSDMTRNFANIEASLPHVLQLYQSDMSYSDFSRSAESLRSRPIGSLMHAALYLSVLIVDFYALTCMLTHYAETNSKPTHIVAYVGFHHFDNYVDYFGGRAEIVGKSGSDQRCETCASMTQPFLVPKHQATNVTLMIPRSFSESLLQAISSSSSESSRAVAKQPRGIVPVFDDEGVLSGPSFAYPQSSIFTNPFASGAFDILSYARPSKHELVGTHRHQPSHGSTSNDRHASHHHQRQSSRGSAEEHKRKEKKSKHSKSRSSSKSHNKHRKSHETKRKHSRHSSKSRSSVQHHQPHSHVGQSVRLIPRASSPLPYTLRQLSTPPNITSVSLSRATAAASPTLALFRQAYPNLYS